MIKKIAFLLLFGSLSVAATAQTRVRLNMLEKSPLSNMIVVTKNDSTARYTRLVAGTGVTIAYNEADTTLTLSATASAGNTDEQTLTFDPSTGNLSISNGNTVNLTEGIQDAVANMLVAGTNVTLTYDDGAGTLTIAASGTGGGASDLGSLTDVDTTGKADGYVLAYNSATSTWEAQDNTLSIDSTGRVFTVALGNQSVSFEDQVGLTSVRLADLQDVDTTGEATGSIMLYDATSGNWEAQSNSINNLTDGYKFAVDNLILGRKPFPGYNGAKNIIITTNGIDSLRSPDGYSVGMVIIGDNAYDKAKAGSANSVVIGSSAMINSTGGEDMVVIGGDAARNLNTGSGVYIGSKAGRNLSGSIELTRYNTIIGTSAQEGGTNVSEAVIIGNTAYAPSNTINSIVIGSGTIISGQYILNIGKGSNSAKLGNERIDSTFLYGNLVLPEYGLGNKEATDLTKTRSAYIAAFATDGTLLELDTTGLFGGGSGTPQTLTFSESTRELTISDGNTVDLSEGIQEEMNSTLVAGTGITITYDDALNTITVAAPAGSGNTDEQTLSLDNVTAALSISNGNSVDLSEAIDNQVNTLTVAGTNIAKVYDDGANTLTLSTTDALTAIDAITFDANTTSEVANRLQFNTDYNTLTFGMANATPIRIGQDLGWFVKNQSGTTIGKGVAVMAVGTVGASGRILIDELVADGSVDAHYFLGVTAESIADGADGFVTSQGHIRGVNTTAFTAGAVLYASPTIPGAFTATEPTGNDLKLPLAFVINSAANGEIAVKADAGASLKDLHDVDVTGIANNSILKYNSTSQVWAIGTDNIDDADNDPTNELQDLSLTGTTLSLTNDATTVDLSGFLQNTLSADVTITGNTNDYIYNNIDNFEINLAGTKTFYAGHAKMYINFDAIALKLFASDQPINLEAAQGIVFENHGTGTREAADLGKTNSDYFARFATDGTIVESTALVSEVDGSVTNEGSLSVTAGTGTTSVINSNTSGSAAVTLEASTGLSIGEAGNTITLTNTAPDQTVSLTGAGITAISGTYPSFTITSTEVDGSVTNEIQDLSLSNNILSLSNSSATVDLSPYVNNITSVGSGLTLSSGALRLGGDLTQSINLDIRTGGSFNVSRNTIAILTAPVTGDVLLTAPDANLRLTGSGTGKGIIFQQYGLGNKEIGDFTSQTASSYLAGFSTTGTLIEVPTSSLATTASNGLTKTGDNIALGGTLTSPTTITLGSGNAFTIGGTNTGLVVNQTTGIVGLGGTVTTTNYGLNNMEASDLGKTFSGNYAGFADDGTVIEVNALPISTGTSGAISWANLPQRIHVLDFGANTSITLSFSNVRVGGIYTLRVTGNSGTDTLVWPGTAKFEDGTSAGTVTLQDGGQMFTFYWDGTNYWVK